MMEAAQRVYRDGWNHTNYDGCLDRYPEPSDIAELRTANPDCPACQAAIALADAVKGAALVSGDRPLDVNRMLHARKNVERRNDRAFSFDRDIDTLAAEYDRLSPGVSQPPAAAGLPVGLDVTALARALIDPATYEDVPWPFHAVGSTRVYNPALLAAAYERERGALSAPADPKAES